jgi:integrase
LAGGQRIEQIVRLRWEDVQDDAFTIYDAKGRPGHGARPHLLPLVTHLATTLNGMDRAGEYVFSTTQGRKRISATTLANWAREAVGSSLEGFQLKRIRSGIETVLAANGVSREIRGHLQSHGLTGVQARHYDGHDYMRQKRQALELLFNLLESEPHPRVVRMEKHCA